MTADFLDIRCPTCNRLLLQVSGLAMIRVKCGKCKTVVGWPVLAAEIVPEVRGVEVQRMDAASFQSTR